MNVIRSFVPNSQENYNHLVFCPTTRVAAAVDPYDSQHLVDLAKSHELLITQIWITHEHGDHIRDVSKLKAMTDATVFAPKTCHGKFTADHWLENDEDLCLGNNKVKHLLSPGHTPGHGVFVFTSSDTQNDFLICADTLFNAGIGNVYSGDVNVLFDTIQLLKKLIPDSARLYPGHDYMINNLGFVLHYFPNCLAAKNLLSIATKQTADSRQIQTFGDEKRCNPFLCLDAHWVSEHPELKTLTERERFIKLREWRNNW